MQQEAKAEHRRGNRGSRKAALETATYARPLLDDAPVCALGSDPIRDADEAFARRRDAIIDGFRRILTDRNA